MAQISASVGQHSDTTFRGYSSAQVQEYARRQGGYPKSLIDEIVTLHETTNGSFGCLLDLGCGPGNATRDLAMHFDYAIGLDPSAEMIVSAQSIGARAKKSTIAYMHGEAELCEDVADESVDLITAATSAHWFDMDRLWPTAARVLKPHGTVAIFTTWRIYVHPAKTPHAEQIQQILIELEQGDSGLGPYQRPGSWSLMGMYADLHMPWSISPPCSSFLEASYRRQVWNEHGLALDNSSYLCGEPEMTLEEAEQAISTISAATRWREAHPDLAHTDKDCIKAAFAEIRGILGATENDKITMVGPTVLVTVKNS